MRAAHDPNCKHCKWQAPTRCCATDRGYHVIPGPRGPRAVYCGESYPTEEEERAKKEKAS